VPRKRCYWPIFAPLHRQHPGGSSLRLRGHGVPRRRTAATAGRPRPLKIQNLRPLGRPITITTRASGCWLKLPLAAAAAVAAAGGLGLGGAAGWAPGSHARGEPPVGGLVPDPRGDARWSCEIAPICRDLPLNNADVPQWLNIFHPGPPEL
jgi:hypothetical protein